MTPKTSGQTTKVTLSRMNVFSVAKWHCLTGLITGILTGIIYFAVAFTSSPSYFEDFEKLLRYVTWYLIATPAIYVFVTFIGSIVGTALYNLLGKSFGRMKFEVELEELKDSLQPPPPPETWSENEF